MTGGPVYFSNCLAGAIPARQLSYAEPFNAIRLREALSLSHRPVGELTNAGVGAMGLKRGRPVQFHWPLVGPQKGRLPLLVPLGLGPAPRGLATAP